MRIAWREDPELVRQVAEAVFDSYDGQKAAWEPGPPDRVWEINLGGRAGVVGVDLGGRRACAKLFYDGMLRSRLRSLFGVSKALRAYRNGRRLQLRGIDCPKSLGFAELRPWGPSMLISELAEGFVGLDRWVIEHGPGRAFLRQLARFIRRMHDAGVSHIDLLPRNVLVRQRPCEGQAWPVLHLPHGGEPHFDFRLVDLEDVQFRRRISHRRRLYELRHLNDPWLAAVSPKARLRFLRYYVGSSDLGPWARPLLRRVYALRPQGRVMRVPWQRPDNGPRLGKPEESGTTTTPRRSADAA